MPSSSVRISLKDIMYSSAFSEAVTELAADIITSYQMGNATLSKLKLIRDIRDKISRHHNLHYRETGGDVQERINEILLDETFPSMGIVYHPSKPVVMANDFKNIEDIVYQLIKEK